MYSDTCMDGSMYNFPIFRTQRYAYLGIDSVGLHFNNYISTTEWS